MAATRDERQGSGREALASIEISLLLEAICRRYGRDFRSFAQASLERRVIELVESAGAASIADLIPRVLRDEVFASAAIEALGARPSEMFRDPAFHSALRERVIPALKTWPRVKAWVAGCGAGEEAYATSIVLAEAGLGARSTIYATDASEVALAKAREGIYPTDRLRAFTQAYLEAGGAHPFSDYYRVSYGAAIVAPEIRTPISFMQHDLTADGALGEMHLVVCRDLLVYFDRALHARAVAIFADSLVRGGFLCLGVKEDLGCEPAALGLAVVDDRAGIFKRVARP